MDEIFELSPELVLELANISDVTKKEKAIEEYISKILPKVSPVTEFPANLEWFNVNSPLKLKKELAGKLVILDFFTYCCINCLHVLPELKIIEKKYKVEDGLVVVGVHSAKFDTEKDSANVAAAVLRHEITHPVVNDSNMIIWESLNIMCWPTLLVLAPGGSPLFLLMGEGHLEILDLFVKSALKYFKLKEKISNNALNEISLKAHYSAGSLLKFPGRIALHNNQLAISDSGHHRILIIDYKTSVIINTIGCMESGFIDGNFDNAKFNTPQGIIWYNDQILYVADTENHAIRKIDLKMGKVITVAGTGVMGTDRQGGLTDDALSQPLSSPWGLSFDLSRNLLLIAMAGTHQIWALVLESIKWWKGKELDKGKCLAIVGSGREENRNSGYPMTAGLAQPSGLTLYANKLFFADSESSSIRQINLIDGRVSPIVGGEKDPNNLFSFGDIDGIGISAKLQHPLDVAWSNKRKILYVADTFNHKIKAINLDTNTCERLRLLGEDKKLLEPGGIWLDDINNTLIVADTNNHCIKLIDLNNNHTNKMNIQYATTVDSSMKNLTLSTTTTKISTSQGSIKIKLEVSVDINISNEAPQTWKLTNLPVGWNAVEKGKFNLINSTSMDAIININYPNGTDDVKLKFTAIVVTCNDGQCKMNTLSKELNITRIENHDSDKSITIKF